VTARRPELAGFGPHVALLALAALQVVFFGVAHRTHSELVAASREGSEHERLAALHVLANRGEPDAARFGPAFVAELLADDARPILRRFAFTNDVCKFAFPALQLEWLLARLGGAEVLPGHLLDFVVQCRKVGGESVGAASSMGALEARWAARAAVGGGWDAADGARVRAHLAPTLSAIAENLESKR